jgi:hypothetical protein
MGEHSASPHEVTLVENTLDNLLVDKAHEREKPDQWLERERAIALIEPHESNRMKPKRLDDRTLRRYRHRRRIEQLLARFQNLPSFGNPGRMPYRQRTRFSRLARTVVLSRYFGSEHFKC